MIDLENAPIEQSDKEKAVADVFSAYAAFKPPERVTVSEGAARSLIIKQTGGTSAPWSAAETPYMVEPINTLASRRHESVVFVGPARCGKTEGLITGWMTHAIVNDPGDMAIVHMSQEKAREFSRTTIDRAIRHSPDLQALKTGNANTDNTFDKSFKHGMWLKIAWPTVSNLSGSTYRYVAFTDYDRMPDDIGGEGAPYPLGLKRTQTFLSRGMCLVESSPGRDIDDPNWQPATRHEAPPVRGILGIYNTSDRRRWYWKCPDCRDWFEAAPGVGLFNLPDEIELLDLVRTDSIDSLAEKYARIVCPHCGSIHTQASRKMFNATGRWIPDGVIINSDDEIIGEPLSSSVAGFWLGGVAAAFQPWKSILTRHFQGLQQYALNGSEETLKNAVNVDQGMPYLSMHLREAVKGAKSPAERASATNDRFVVPEGTRFITAAVDIQGGAGSRFVVQVHAHGINFENWLIDRYEIRESKREGMGAEFAPIDPASYAEDWDILTEKVVRCTYRTPFENLEMRVKMVAVDSGGEDGVTDKAYAWYRRLRRENLHKRVMLVKGASTKGAPIIKESWVGNRSGREKGDIPIYLLNTNLLKDAVYAGIQRTSPGPGYHHFPAPKTVGNPKGWLPQSFFDELNAEVREKSGVWKQIRKRNEAFDLCCYNRAACLRLGVDKIKDWANAPKWALPIDRNSETITKEERREMKQNTAIPIEVDAPVPVIPQSRIRPRRTVRSGYLG
jgi:phage terminase large subunit GpA-like protein